MGNRKDTPVSEPSSPIFESKYVKLFNDYAPDSPEAKDESDKRKQSLTFEREYVSLPGDKTTASFDYELECDDGDVQMIPESPIHENRSPHLKRYSEGMEPELETSNAYSDIVLSLTPGQRPQESQVSGSPELSRYFSLSPISVLDSPSFSGFAQRANCQPGEAPMDIVEENTSRDFFGEEGDSIEDSTNSNPMGVSNGTTAGIRKNVSWIEDHEVLASPRTCNTDSRVSRILRNSNEDSNLRISPSNPNSPQNMFPETLSPSLEIDMRHHNAARQSKALQVPYKATSPEEKEAPLPQNETRAKDGTTLPRKNSNHAFLEIRVLAEMLLNEETKPVDMIPEGVKENTYFIVDDSSNCSRQKSLRARHEDDCGAWRSLTGGNKQFVLYKPDERALQKQIHFRHGQFCSLITMNKERVYVPLDPQPTEDHIIA
jgi:hypothetical protein